jgi:hypothetical protein
MGAASILGDHRAEAILHKRTHQVAENKGFSILASRKTKLSNPNPATYISAMLYRKITKRSQICQGFAELSGMMLPRRARPGARPLSSIAAVARIAPFCKSKSVKTNPPQIRRMDRVT